SGAILRHTSARRPSASTATTSAPASTRPRVSDPRPGPTSTTWSPATTPDKDTMRRTVLGSARKFWPRVWRGRSPWSRRRARIWAGPRRLTSPFDAHGDHAGVEWSQGLEGVVRQVDDAPAHVGTPVVDGHVDRETVLEVGDADN